MLQSAVANPIVFQMEEVKRSVERLIRRVVKVASRVSCHSRYWWVHVASA